MIDSTFLLHPAVNIYTAKGIKENLMNMAAEKMEKAKKTLGVKLNIELGVK
jgi:hypothetical protein